MTVGKGKLKKPDKLANNKQFAVPDGYFESFADKLMERINTEQPTEQADSNEIRFPGIRKTLAWAASLAAMFLLTYTGISILGPSSGIKLLSESEVMAALESEIQYIDESQFYYLLEENTKETSLEGTDLSEEEITTFLIQEGADIELLNTDF